MMDPTSSANDGADERSAIDTATALERTPSRREILRPACRSPPVQVLCRSPQTAPLPRGQDSDAATRDRLLRAARDARRRVLLQGATVISMDPAVGLALGPSYATRTRSRSEQGSISTMILLIAVLGALRRPTNFVRMKPAASNFASVRVKFGCARPVISANSATERGLRSRITASSRRFSGVNSRTKASTELKLGFAASAGADRSPRETALISRSSEVRF